MDGIYLVQCSDQYMQNPAYIVNCYDSIEDIALMNFLCLLQEDKMPVANLLDSDTYSSYIDLYDGYCAEGCIADVFHAAYYFLDNVPTSIVDCLSANLLQFVKTSTVCHDLESFKACMMQWAPAVKCVTKSCSYGDKFNSYSTVKAPLAYVLGSDVDSEACMMQWVSDSVLNSLFSVMQKCEFSNFDTLRAFIMSSARDYFLDYDILSIQIQGVLVRKLISGIHVQKYLNKGFDSLVSNLVNSIGGCYDNTTACSKLF